MNEYNLNKGDVILYKDQYHVIVSIDKSIKTYSLSLFSNKPLIQINGLNYGIKTVNFRFFNKISDYEVVGKIKCEDIDEKIKETNRIAKVGDIIYFERNNYYVYEENDSTFNCFKINDYSDKAGIKKKININNKQYQAVWYELEEIKYNENYKIYDKANEKEIMDIKKKQDKFFYFSNKGMDKSLQLSSHWVVKTKNDYLNKKYIVLKKIGNKILLISVEDANNMYFDDIIIKSAINFIPLYKIGDYTYNKIFGDCLLSIPKNRKENDEKIKAYHKYLSKVNEMKNNA